MEKAVKPSLSFYLPKHGKGIARLCQPHTQKHGAKAGMEEACNLPYNKAQLCQQPCGKKRQYSEHPKAFRAQQPVHNLNLYPYQL